MNEFDEALVADLLLPPSQQKMCAELSKSESDFIDQMRAIYAPLPIRALGPTCTPRVPPQDTTPPKIVPGSLRDRYLRLKRTV